MAQILTMRYRKAPKMKYPNHPFCRKVRAIARSMPHKEVLKRLGISRHTLSNWMYICSPRPLTIKLMQPVVDKLHAEVTKNGD